MIVRKYWMRRVRDGRGGAYYYEGWFLLGFIPLYVHRSGTHQS